MPIQRTHGSVTNLAKLAKLAGQAKQAAREQELREQAYNRAQELASRERMMQFQAQLKEQLDYRNLEFQAEKIEAAQQHDFMMEESRRQALYDRELQQDIKKLNQRDQAIEAIMNDGSLDPMQKDRMVREIKLKHLNYINAIKTDDLDRRYKEAQIQRLEADAALNRILDINAGTPTNTSTPAVNDPMGLKQ